MKAVVATTSILLALGSHMLASASTVKHKNAPVRKHKIRVTSL